MTSEKNPYLIVLGMAQDGGVPQAGTKQHLGSRDADDPNFPVRHFASNHGRLQTDTKFQRHEIGVEEAHAKAPDNWICRLPAKHS